MVGIPSFAGLKKFDLPDKMTNVTVQGLGIFLYVFVSHIPKVFAH
jgi:hypothetical protein